MGRGPAHSLGKGRMDLRQWQRRNLSFRSLRLEDGNMSELAVTTRAHPGRGADPSGEEFVRAFNAVRNELVSTLFFVLGNHDDAQDAAQDAFLKCWRTRASLREVRNLRAWIFRVGLNAAKDL